MANDSLSIDHSTVNQGHHSSPKYPPLILHLERARSWCECLLHHDLDSIEMPQFVLRNHLLALAEAIEVAYLVGMKLSGVKRDYSPFEKENMDE